MSADKVYCHILGGDVTVITDINGDVKNVVCPQFERVTHSCYKKSRNTGFLGNVLKKIADKAIDTRASYCEFGDPDHLWK